MNENMFSVREGEIFKTLKELKEHDFVIIGGYAVNAYTLPRFSVDCDIVVKNNDQLQQIEKTLFSLGYKKEKIPKEMQYSGQFFRYEKKLDNNFTVSMDILAGEVRDRMTGVAFQAEWVFKNSAISILKGKTIAEELKVRIITIDALLVMKMISCRSTDIRDVFMMFPHATDEEWIISQIQMRCDLYDRLTKIIEKISSSQFKDGLSGVYGYVDLTVFEKHKNAILKYSGKV